MALNESAVWMIAYDIRCPRRLRRVHAFLKAEAVWVQYSVFVTSANAQQLGVIRARLDDFIDRKVDDVRIYRVPQSPSLATLGHQGLPDGMSLLAGGNVASLTQLTSAGGGE
jgi:CRISPR-associated protein Cas2